MNGIGCARYDTATTIIIITARYSIIHMIKKKKKGGEEEARCYYWDLVYERFPMKERFKISRESRMKCSSRHQPTLLLVSLTL